MSKNPKDIFVKYLEKYVEKRVKKNIRRDKSYSKSIVKKAIGGKNIFASKKEKLEFKERKKRDWYSFWEEMSEPQKEQFLKWFNKTIASQSSLGKRAWTTNQGLAFLNRRMTQLSNIYFNKQGKLTPKQWEFVNEMSEFFGDILGNTKPPTSAKDKIEELDGWRTPNKPSSWIIKFRYDGEKKKDSKGDLTIRTKRGTGIYTFYNFPYVEYVMLNYLTTSLGEYWWEKWLWRYSVNPTKFRKFAYKKNLSKFEKFLGERNG